MTTCSISQLRLCSETIHGHSRVPQMMRLEYLFTLCVKGKVEDTSGVKQKLLMSKRLGSDGVTTCVASMSTIKDVRCGYLSMHCSHNFISWTDIRFCCPMIDTKQQRKSKT